MGFTTASASSSAVETYTGEDEMLRTKFMSLMLPNLSGAEAWQFTEP